MPQSNDVKSRIEQMKKGLTRESNPFLNIKDKIVEESGKRIELLDTELLISAPNKWNIYPPITDDAMIEMIFSVMENGLFNPIIVWKRGHKYMILAGHNRTTAYRTIIEEYKDVEGFNIEPFLKIPAIVYERKEINRFKAREIIIDSNYIQRKSDTRLMPKIVKERMEIVGHRMDSKGRTVKIVAEELGLSKTRVYEDVVIATDLIKKGQELFFDGIINKKAALALGRMPQEIQEWIFDNYEDYISSKLLNLLKIGYTEEDIEEIFDRTIIGPETITICMEIPKELTDSFRMMAGKWIEDQKKSL